MENPYQNSLSINVDLDHQHGGYLNPAGLVLEQGEEQHQLQQQDMGIARFSQRVSPSLDNLFSNREVLARRLKNRPDRDDLVDRNIIPAHAHSPAIFNKVTQLERKKTGDFLTKKIRARPSRQQLIQRHILSEDTRVDPSLLEKVGKLERQRIADQLNERLLKRPGPIELIQEHILPVESPIQNAIEQGNLDYQQTVSPASSHADSPSVTDLESGINTLNCTSPSPPPPMMDQHQINLTDISFQKQLRSVSESSSLSSPMYTDTNFNKSSQISLSQKENERLVKSLNKKTRQTKPKVKKLKFHECLPGNTTGQKQPQEPNSEIVDERYKRLLEQQTIYLRLQVMQQNAVMNALQGNTESMEQVNEEIEHIITKEQKKSSEPQPIKSIDGKKLDDLRVIDLRAQLKQRGLLVSGSKAKLIERLAAFEEGKASPSDFAYSNSTVQDSTLGIVASKVATQPVTEMPPPVTTVMQVTAYATNSGQTYQVIQAVPQSTQNIMQYQVLPTHCATSATNSGGPMTQLRLDQVSPLPVVAVTQPNVMTVQEKVSDKPLRTQATPSPSTIQFHVTPPPQQQSPTIVLHSGPPLQQASIYHRDKPKVKVQKLPVISQGQCFNLSDSHQRLSQSVPMQQQYNNNYLVDSNTANLNYTSLNQDLTSTDSHDIFQQQNFRGRASSEPASHLTKLKINKLDSTKSVFSNNSNSPSSMLQSPSPIDSYLNNHLNQRQMSKDSNVSSIKSENIEDIMDIIGELSSPSSNQAGVKSEEPPPYNSCLYDKSKFLNVGQQNKPFNTSMPDNINLLSGSPSQNFLNSSYSPYPGGFNHTSSTGSIPQQAELSTSPYSRTTTPSNFMNCNSMSPVSAMTDDPMELERFPSPMGGNNTLNWLDLNMEPGSPNMNFQGMSSNNGESSSNLNMSSGFGDFNTTPSNNIYTNPHATYQNRSQTSILYGSSPKPQDGYISLFDLEGGDY